MLGRKFVIFLLLIRCIVVIAQSSTCNFYTTCEARELWKYNTDANKKLVYVIDYCKHNGLHPSIIKITRSDENDTSKIVGNLDLDNGYFDNSEQNKDITKFNSDVSANSEVWGDHKQRSLKITYEKWFGIMRVRAYITRCPNLSFSGKCVVDEETVSKFDPKASGSKSTDIPE